MLDLKALLSKILDALKVDYVVEEGSSGGWVYYRKWKSGKAELWGYFSATYTSYATNAWVIGSSSLTAYPFNITNPYAQATLEKIGTGGGIVTYDYRRTDYWSGIANGVNQSVSSGTSRTITWTVYVLANWGGVIESIKRFFTSFSSPKDWGWAMC